MQSVTKTKSAGWSSWLAWPPLVLSAAMVAGMLWLRSAGCEFEEYALTTLLAVTTGLGFGLLGALIVHFRPENRIGWICVVIGFLFTLQSFTGAYTECGFAGIISLPTVPFIAWLNYWITPFMALFLFVLLPLLFPDGRFLSPRWRRVSLALLSLVSFFIVVSAFLSGPLAYNGMDPVNPIDNPMGLAFLPATLGPNVDALISLTLIATALLAISSLVIRWRRSVGDTRQQLKWFAYFLATAVAIQLVVFEMVGAFFNPEIFYTIWYRAIILVVFTGFPIVIGIAVFKYRLYDIDIIIRKTLVYGALTILLALVYFGSVLLIQGLVTVVGGQQSPIVIVFSTLFIAALFSPLRRRTQAFIDRRFFRRKYDAEQTLAQFAASVRDEVDLDDLTAELLRVVQETMEPEHVSIHLRDQNSV